MTIDETTLDLICNSLGNLPIDKVKTEKIDLKVESTQQKSFSKFIDSLVNASKLTDLKLIIDSSIEINDKSLDELKKKISILGQLKTFSLILPKSVSKEKLFSSQKEHFSILDRSNKTSIKFYIQFQNEIKHKTSTASTSNSIFSVKSNK
jgi:hypothetical protein